MAREGMTDEQYEWTERIAELESQYSGLETVVLHERARVAELNVENESLEGQLLRQETRIAELEALLKRVSNAEIVSGNLRSRIDAALSPEREG